jgi:hypothetical protein
VPAAAGLAPFPTEAAVALDEAAMRVPAVVAMMLAASTTCHLGLLSARLKR